MKNGKKILLIDDKHINANFFDGVLTKLGFVVLRAESAKSAFEVILREKPNIVLSDAVLPDMSCGELLQKLHNESVYEHVQNTPFIVFSETSIDKNLKNNLSEYDDYIIKPIDLAHITVRIDRVLKHADTQKKLKYYEKTLDQILQILHDGYASANESGQSAFKLCIAKINEAKSGLHDFADTQSVEKAFLECELENSFESLSKT